MMKKVLTMVVCGLIGLAAQAQVFYKIEGNGLKSPSYLFGTHHLAPLSVYSDSDPAKKGFANSTCVVGEIDMSLLSDMGTVMQMQQLAIAPSDSTLTKLLPADKIEAYSAKIAELVPGATLQMFDQLKPVVVLNVATVSMVSSKLPGFNPNEQLDTWFQLQGKLEDKEIKALETPMEQAEILYCKMPISAQLKGLCDLLDDTDKAWEKVEELNSAYLAKDLDRLLKLSEEENDAESKAFNKALLEDRNARWLQELPAIMEAQPTFIAVGALHLPGENGLIEGLRKKGYTVTAQ